jgi:hypothetical protein
VRQRTLPAPRCPTLAHHAQALSHAASCVPHGELQLLYVHSSTSSYGLWLAPVAQDSIPHHGVVYSAELSCTVLCPTLSQLAQLWHVNLAQALTSDACARGHRIRLECVEAARGSTLSRLGNVLHNSTMQYRCSQHTSCLEQRSTGVGRTEAVWCKPHNHLPPVPQTVLVHLHCWQLGKYSGIGPS